MKISVLFVASAVAYGSSVAMAVPIQPNLAARDIANTEPINAREISTTIESDLAAREIDIEDLFEREPKRGRGRRGRGRGHRRGRGRRSRSRGRRSRSRAASPAPSLGEAGGQQVEGREIDDEFDLDAREYLEDGLDAREFEDEEDELLARDPQLSVSNFVIQKIHLLTRTFSTNLVTV